MLLLWTHKKSVVNLRPSIYFCYNAVSPGHEMRPGVYMRLAVIGDNTVRTKMLLYALSLTNLLQLVTFPFHLINKVKCNSDNNS